MINRTFLISTLSLALLAGTAAASPDEYEREAYYERRGPMPFELFDLNRDGVVTAEEHAQVRNERRETRANLGYPMRNAPYAPSFEQIDLDNDGSISRDELAASQAQRMPRRGMGMGGPPGRWNN